MRIIVIVTSLLLFTVAARAQVVQPAQMAQPAAPLPAPGVTLAPPPASSSATTHTTQKRMTLKERFDAANITKDGHLTLAQAKAGRMRFTAEHFSEIDARNQGYVTLDEIHAFGRARRLAGRAARPPASAPVQN